MENKKLNNLHGEYLRLEELRENNGLTESGLELLEEIKFVLDNSQFTPTGTDEKEIEEILNNVWNVWVSQCEKFKYDVNSVVISRTMAFEMLKEALQSRVVNVSEKEMDEFAVELSKWVDDIGYFFIPEQELWFKTGRINEIGLTDKQLLITYKESQLKNKGEFLN